MVNVVSRANQFILGQNVYTYMVNVVQSKCCVYTYMVNVVSRANQFILGQNVYTYMVNVVRRAMIKMFLLIW